MPENDIVTFEPDGIKALLRAPHELSAVANGDRSGDVFDVIMPNGKQLGNCTREEILAYGELARKAAAR
jgi:hypothetical protein